MWGLIALLLVFLGAYLAKSSIYYFIQRMRYQPEISYPSGTIRGIDVSHYQRDIDWRKLSESDLNGAPVSFAIIKATEGKDLLDPYFSKNFVAARKNGIKRGAYHVLSTKSSPQEQATFYCNVVKLRNEDLVPILDVETLGDNTPEQLQGNVLDWMNIIEKYYGVTPILYTSYKFRTSYLNTPEFEKYPFWIAHYYVDSLDYKGDWAIWQHSDMGEIEGISGNVDINVVNGSYRNLMSLTMSESKNKNKK